MDYSHLCGSRGEEQCVWTGLPSIHPAAGSFNSGGRLFREKPRKSSWSCWNQHPFPMHLLRSLPLYDCWDSRILTKTLLWTKVGRRVGTMEGKPHGSRAHVPHNSGECRLTSVLAQLHPWASMHFCTEQSLPFLCCSPWDRHFTVL